MDCRLAHRHVDGYVDEELSPSVIFELEAHLSRCETCQTQVDFARRLKRTLKEQFSDTCAPVGLRESVASALGDELDPLVERRVLRNVGWSVLATAAAALVFFVSDDSTRFYGPQQAGFTPLPVFGDIVKRHRDRTPTEIETQEPERVAQWVDDKLGLHMETVAFMEPQVRLQGVRLSHVGASHAAKLYYRVGERKLTAVVFEATPELLGSLKQEPAIHRERVGKREIAYYNVQGYTVPIIEHNGLIYGFAGDLGQNQLLRLVGTAQLP